MESKPPHKKFSSPVASGSKVQELRDVLEGKSFHGEEGEGQAQLDQEIAELKDKLAKAEKEASELKEEALRARAESQNFKKRMEREKEEMVKFSNEKLLNEILPIVDHLEMTLVHANQSPDKKESAKPDPIVEGVGMVLKQFLGTLEKFGLKAVEGVGAPFDPHLQEAIGTVATQQHEPGNVVSVHRKGFLLNGRLIRPAMVTIAEAPAGDANSKAQTVH